MKKKKNSKVYEYLKAFSGATLSGTAGDGQSAETKKGFFRSLFDKKEDEDNKFNVGHATLMGLNIFNHLLPQQNLYNNNPIILESYNPNMYGTGSQAIMQNGGTVNGGGGGKERLVGDDFYAANATLSYYKNILNEKLKEKNPEAFSNYFKKLVEFRRNNDVEGEKKYIQESDYNEFLTPQEVREILGEKHYAKFLSSLSHVNAYNIKKGAPPLYGDIEGKQNSLADLNYGRRFASLSVTPSQTIHNKTRNTNYTRTAIYNPETLEVEFEESGDMQLRPQVAVSPETSRTHPRNFESGGTIDPPTFLERMREAFAMAESSNNYFAKAKKGTAFGRYQFLKGTRKDLWKKNFKEEFNTFDEFDEAYKTSPELQDRVMDAHLQSQIDLYGENPEAIALVHRLGRGGYKRITKNQALLNEPISATDKETPQQYLDKLKKYGAPMPQTLEEVVVTPSGNYSSAKMKAGGKLYANAGLLAPKGSVEQLSDNIYDGGTIKFKGNSHKEGGIDISYGNTNVNVEGEETGFVDSRGNMNIMGNMFVPGTRTKFKKIFEEIGKQEEKYNKLIEKGSKLIVDNNPENRFEALKYNAGKAMVSGGKSGQADLAVKKDKLAQIQKHMLEVADSLGLDPIELSKGVEKKAKNMGNKAKSGKSIPKDDLIVQARLAARRHGIDEQFFVDLIQNESSFNVEAKGYKLNKRNEGVTYPLPKVKEVVARGLVQFTKPVAESFGLDWEKDLHSSDPAMIKKVLDAGAKFFQNLLTKYEGDYILAAAEYNGGPRAIESVRKALNKTGITGQEWVKVMEERNKKSPNSPSHAWHKETLNYVKKTVLPRFDFTTYTLTPANLPPLPENAEVVTDTLPTTNTGSPLINNPSVQTSTSSNYDIENAPWRFHNLVGDALVGPPTTPIQSLNNRQETNSTTPIQSLDNNKGTNSSVPSRAPSSNLPIPKDQLWMYEDIPEYLKKYRTLSDYRQFPNIEGPNTGNIPLPEITNASNIPGWKSPILQNGEKEKSESQEEINSTKTTPITSNIGRMSLLQVLPEIVAMGQNTVEPVPLQQYRPDLFSPFEVSFDDRRNENRSTFNSIISQLSDNPAAMATIAAQKYAADNAVAAEEFRTNQAIDNEVTNKNIELLNQAQLQNLGLQDQQFVRESTARSKTRAQNQMILQSIAAKQLQHDANNRRLAIYENLYDYRAIDSNGDGIPDTMQYQGGPASFNINTSGVPSAGPQMVLPPNNPNTSQTVVKDADGKIKTVREHTPSFLKSLETNLLKAFNSTPTVKKSRRGG